MKTKYDTLDEQEVALFYESVSILRDNEHFKVYLKAIEDLQESTKMGLLKCKSMEDVTKLQMYYAFLSDLLRYAYVEEPNLEPPTDQPE